MWPLIAGGRSVIVASEDRSSVNRVWRVLPQAGSFFCILERLGGWSPRRVVLTGQSPVCCVVNPSAQ